MKIKAMGGYGAQDVPEMRSGWISYNNAFDLVFVNLIEFYHHNFDTRKYIVKASDLDMIHEVWLTIVQPE